MRGKKKFTNAQVIEIKKLLKENKVKISWICNVFNCKKQDINNIKNHNYYSDLNQFVN